MALSAVGWVTIALVLLLLLFVIVQFNRMVGLRLRIRESWANVDTELKRRYDLIPNLVEAVKGYARHERILFENVARLRTNLLHATADSPERRREEQQLAGLLKGLLAVAEQYPKLRASENFLHLQVQLVETEDRIQAARRFYNANVRDYNNQVQQFPSNAVARTFRFAPHEYFELPTVAERAVPIVKVY